MSYSNVASSASSAEHDDGNQAWASGVLASSDSDSVETESQVNIFPDIEYLEKLSKLDLADSATEDSGVGPSNPDGGETTRQFDPARCLFCDQQSADFPGNMSHMQKRHGLLIPCPESLIVDLETLVGYLHLVIFEYSECLCCGSMRNTPQAAQQHMMGKAHCRFDIAKEDSEFRDFYSFEQGSDSGDDAKTDQHMVNRSDNLDAKMAQKTRRLASGKVVSHRNTKSSRVNQSEGRIVKDTASSSILAEQSNLTSDISLAPTHGGNSKKELEREKQAIVIDRQLATLRSGDQQTLMHLSRSQQIVFLVRSKRQQEKWNRDQVAREIKRQVKVRR